MAMAPAYHGPFEYRSRAFDAPADHSALWDALVDAARLAIFHALNAGLGFLAFSVCVAGVSSTFATLPLCCFGVLVFRLTLYAVYGFAQLDVLLFNFASHEEARVFMQLPPHAAHNLYFRGERLAPKLSSFSPLSLMALIYFLSIKFGIALMSIAALSTTVAPPVSLLASFLGVEVDKAWFTYTLGPEDVATLQSDPGLFLVASLCLFLIGVALMHLVAHLSKAATRFFCCERFSTYRAMEQQYPPDASFFPVATATYGAVGHVPRAMPVATATEAFP
ncbi:hypothetical protein PINS_up010894 [Pythium insidiosum]|nr:hypothetical protein PINS_up010894 [Pythium insidiosum]